MKHIMSESQDVSIIQALYYFDPINDETPDQLE